MKRKHTIGMKLEEHANTTFVILVVLIFVITYAQKDTCEDVLRNIVINILRKKKTERVDLSPLENKKVTKEKNEMPVKETTARMTDRERHELIERIKGMSVEELEVVIDIIPIDICMKRITDEINKAKDVQNSLLAMAKNWDDLK